MQRLADPHVQVLVAVEVDRAPAPHAPASGLGAVRRLQRGLEPLRLCGGFTFGDYGILRLGRL